MPPRRRLCERACAQGRIPGSLGGQAAVASESPGALDENTDADPLALGIGEALDAAVLGRDELVSLQNDSGVRVLGACAGSRINRRRAEIAHRQDFSWPLGRAKSARFARMMISRGSPAWSLRRDVLRLH
jgi:hypothetical protein